MPKIDKYPSLSSDYISDEDLIILETQNGTANTSIAELIEKIKEKVNVGLSPEAANILIRSFVLVVELLKSAVYTANKSTSISLLESLISDLESMISSESSGGSSDGEGSGGGNVTPTPPETTDPEPDNPGTTEPDGPGSDPEPVRQDIITKSGSLLTITQLANDPTKSGNTFTI